MAVIVGAMRYETGIAFPTAFILLNMVGFLGLGLIAYEKEYIKKTDWIICLIIFEIGLGISVWLSYTEKIEYLIAYNAGLALFFVMKNKNIMVPILSGLGKIGFIFFLCAEIPWIIMTNLVTINNLWTNILLHILKFVFSILISWMGTRFIEKPMLTWGKEVEKKLL